MQVMQVEQDIPDSTLVRVYLLGPLEIWKKDPSGTWKPVSKDKWKNSKPARSVFKRLLVQPGRRLARSTIEDDLWLESDHFELTTKNVYNAISLIRGIIGKPLVTCWEAAYKIAGQTLVWTDLDACAALLKEVENQGQGSIQAVSLLERAVVLLERGELLEGEDGRWCYAFRRRAEDMFRQARLWLAESYEAEGKLWQAGEQYRAVILTYPSDEDALQRWLEMLIRHGKRQEALKCYQDMKDFVEAQGYTLSFAVEQHIISLETGQDNVNRRKATQSISILVGDLLLTNRPMLSLIRAGELLHSEEVVSVCTATIPILWRLYFDGHLAEVQQPLFSEHLPSLLVLLENPGFQKRAAGLAAKASQLAALIEKHHHNSGNALRYAEQGEQYGQLVEDPNLQVAALIQQGNIYFDLGQAGRELEAYQKAYHLCQEAKRNSEISPLLLGRVYIGLAKSSGRFRDYKQEALRFLGMAHETYPEHPETDAAFSYSYHTRFTLLNHTGLTYLNIGNPRQAMSTFEQVPVPAELVPRRLELLVRLAMASFALGNLRQTCENVRLVTTSARTLGSNLRYNEAYSIYEQMADKWPHETHVKDLAQYFR
jgi:DNA-binding SARP family transcriptional activator